MATASFPSCGDKRQDPMAEGEAEEERVGGGGGGCTPILAEKLGAAKRETGGRREAVESRQDRRLGTPIDANMIFILRVDVREKDRE